ncbi:MAG: hypothetical protein U0892_06630 [Pirellulales bacterium]
MSPEEILKAYQYLETFKDLAKKAREALDKDTDSPPNPHFVQNGIDGTSKKTASNLRKRRIKAFAGSVFSFGGTLASSVTAVNAADVGKHSAAIGSSAIHLTRFGTMASKVRDGGSLHRTLMALCALKSMKIAARGTKVAVSFIPVPGISLVGKIVGDVHEQALAFKQAAILKIAFDLHWQAYREMKIGGPNARGPALDICRSLVCLSATHAAGNSETALDVGGLHSAQGLNEILNEPCGYMVLAYKLNQT